MRPNEFVTVYAPLLNRTLPKVYPIRARTTLSVTKQHKIARTTYTSYLYLHTVDLDLSKADTTQTNGQGEGRGREGGREGGSEGGREGRREGGGGGGWESSRGSAKEAYYTIWQGRRESRQRCSMVKKTICSSGTREAIVGRCSAGKSCKDRVNDDK